VTLLPGPSSVFTGAPEEQIVDLLSRPSTVRSINRPVVCLADGRCVGYQASVRVSEWAARSSAPWFRAAAETGLSGQLGALALLAALRERATMPGERFLAVELDPDAIGHRDVIEVLAAEDDVADLVITLISADLPAGHRALAVLEEFRARGLMLAAPVGQAGLSDLVAVERLGPDLIMISPELVRGVHREPIQQRLIEVVVELADGIGAATLAEEVETLDEARTLRAGGVRVAQGWLFGRARPGFVPPAAEVSEWLRVQQGG
jgi:EAL domain-containing protein (putative c-di-GMP-specific phosphodiesterase class I)